MEAYLYSITDTVNDKLYIGWHKGTPDDGYFCTTYNKEFKEIIKTRPETLIKNIIAFGTQEDIYKLETAILVAEDAMNNYSYYNLSNNFGRKCSNPTSGTSWWNNGLTNKRSFECPGDGWTMGRLGCSIGGATRFGPHTEESKKKMKAAAIGNTNGNKKLSYKGKIYNSIKSFIDDTGYSYYFVCKMIETGTVKRIK